MKLIEQIKDFTTLLLEVSFMPPNEDSNERKLNLQYIEDLSARLFSFPIESIGDSLIAENWTDEVLKNRLKTARLLLKDWITPDGIAQFETDDLLSTDSESMKYVCSKLGVTDGRKYMLKVFTLFREANLCLRIVAKDLREVENLLTPQPDTSTEQEQRVEQNIILQRKDIKLIFDKAVSYGLMKFEDGYYCWLKKSELLAYFCKQVSLKRDLAEKYSEKTGEPQTNWKVFSGVFKIIARQGKNKGCWSLQTGRQIEGFMKGYMKYYSTFAPNGCELVDDLF